MEQECRVDVLSGIAVSACPGRLEGGQLVICERGTACININLNKYSLKAGSIVWLFHGAIVLYTEASEDFRMTCFTFSQKLLFDAFHSIPSDKIAWLRENSYLHLGDGSCQQICSYVMILASACNNCDHLYQRDLVISGIRLFLYEACNYIEREGTIATKGFRGNELKSKFIALVISSVREHRQVGYYAGKLCVTPHYLSMTLQRILGCSAKEWIDDYLILEIKILLRSSSLSMQEIADELNFPDQSYLGRFFKHKTGMSLSSYRIVNRAIKR